VFTSLEPLKLLKTLGNWSCVPWDCMLEGLKLWPLMGSSFIFYIFLNKGGDFMHYFALFILL
jgi:hypothetical protein